MLSPGAKTDVKQQKIKKFYILQLFVSSTFKTWNTLKSRDVFVI